MGSIDRDRSLAGTVRWLAVWTAVLLVCTAGPRAHAENASSAKVEAANRLLDLSDLEKTLKATIDLVAKRVQTPQGQDLVSYLRSKLDVQKLRANYLQVVLNVYTEAELNAAVEFYSTPLGRSILEKQPQVAAAVAPMVQAEIARLVAQYRAGTGPGQPQPPGPGVSVQHG
jgi:hypothetical protein